MHLPNRDKKFSVRKKTKDNSLCLEKNKNYSVTRTFDSTVSVLLFITTGTPPDTGFPIAESKPTANK